MKQHKNTRRFTSLLTAFAASAACLPTAIAAPQSAVAAEHDIDNYAKLLQYSLYMYDGNMCGKDVEEKSGFSWRGNCHVDDEVPGGFHDCGDHVKFGITAGYSAATLGWSYYEYKDVFDKFGQTGHLKLITDHFAKYFKDCTTLSGDTVTKFVYQIGDGGADHNSYWGPPEEQDSSSRKVFSTTNGASDIAAEYAAALAVNYINFHNEEDLTYAKALWEFSCKGNQVAKDGTGGFYDSKDYKDDQSFAAGWLYLATNDDKYNTFLKANQDDPNWEYCWNNVYLGASILNGEINNDWSIAEKYASQRMTDPSKWYTPDGWGAARYNTAAQFIGLLLTKYKKADYSNWAQGQMNMILGDNPKNVCLVVGYNDKSAKYPHHEAASGLKGWDEYNAAGTTFGPKGGHVLTGALEGGFQDSSFNFKDELNDINSSEVGIDYNATLVAAAAGLYSIFETGSIDEKVNGIDRDIKYDNPQPIETTTAAETTTAETTTTTAVSTTDPNSQESTTVPPKPITQAHANISFTDKETGNIIPGVFYSLTPEHGVAAGSFPTVDYTSSNETDSIDLMWDGITNINEFTWKLRINNVPEGYILPSNPSEKFMVTSDPTVVNIQLEKKKNNIPYNVKVNIIDKETGKQLPGCKFSIEGVGMGDGGAYFGSAIFKSGETADTVNVNWFDLSEESIKKVGYRLSVNEVPEGYLTPSSFPNADFWFTDSNTAEVTVEIEKSPDMSKCTFTLTVKDAVTGKDVPGVQFTVTGRDNKTQTDLAAKNFTTADKPTVIDISSWEDLNNIQSVMWTLTLTSVPEGYKMPEDKFTKEVGFMFSRLNAIKKTIELESDGSKPVPERLWGDANLDEKVTIADAVAILQALGNKDKYALKAEGAINADVFDNGDGVTGKDALTIQQMDAGVYKQTDFPVSYKK